MFSENDLLSELKRLKESCLPIIVEGEKDKRALEKFGITNITTLKGPIYSLCENLSKKYQIIIILTDLDSEGKRLYSIIKANLERNGVSVDDNLRNLLFRYTDLRQIEGLSSYLEKLIK